MSTLTRERLILESFKFVVYVFYPIGFMYYFSLPEVVESHQERTLRMYEKLRTSRAKYLEEQKRLKRERLQEQKKASEETSNEKPSESH